jgi:Asp-tRNA(Asn)/Glu-tRNA(Gln) amidotransferase A subunit family amidase
MLSDHTEDDTMRQGKKIHTAAIGMLCFATLMTGACVTQSTYKTATADLDATKSELQSARAETQGLDQQVDNLQQRKKDLANQMVVSSMALEQATKEIKAERTASQKRLNNLNRTIKHLAAEQKSLRDGFKRATKQRAALQSTVDNYTSQLRPVDERTAPTTPPPAVPINQPVNTTPIHPAETLVQNEPVPKPTMTPTAAPVNQPVANPKPPRGGQLPEPVEEDWLTFFKNWISSLWQSVLF